MHNYQAFGLTISSEIILPELAPSLLSAADPDIVICYGSVSPLKEKRSGPCYHIESCEVAILSIKNVARYQVYRGKKITIDRVDSIDCCSIRTFLLGSAFGILLHQRKLLVLHASVVAVNGECIVFVGCSGAGKSALAVNFYQRGYRVLTDEKCVIVSKERQTVVYPGYPFVRLWADVVIRLGEKIRNLKPVRPQLQKYIFPVPNHFSTHPLPLKRIYFLQEGNKLEVEKITGIEQVRVILKQTYRFRKVEAIGIKESNFIQAMQVIKSVPMYRLTRKRGEYDVKESADLVIRDSQ